MAEGGGERATGTPDVNIHDPNDVVGGVAGGGSGERATGTPNTIYNLSSVLFHSLEGGASYDTYVEDAEREGDEALTEFFRRVREEDRDRAAQARLLLAERAPTPSRPEGPTADVSSGSEQIGPFPGEGDDLSRSTEEASSPRPEPSDAFPGTEPVRGEDPRARSGELPPPPEEIPPERAGERPTAEQVPPPRTIEVPGAAEEVPSGTSPQAPLGDVQRSSTSKLGTGEAPEEKGAGHEEGEDRTLVERLTDRAREGLRGEEEQKRDR